MNILCVDDERIGLAALSNAVKTVMPESNIYEYNYAEDALKAAQDGLRFDIAFMDIRMRGMNGVQLAQNLKLIMPKVNIVFVTGFDEYQGAAFAMHASGYVMKPVTPEKIRVEIENLRHPISEDSFHAGDADRSKLEKGVGYVALGGATASVVSTANVTGLQDGQTEKGAVTITVKAFGNFEIFANGKPIKFKYEKTREMIAYLVDRRGSLCSNGEIIANLWEDDINHNSYLRGLRKDLMDTLNAIGRPDIINLQRGRIGIDTDSIVCDYYEFIKGDLSAINRYRGEYMSQYSWGELTNASLSNN